MDFGIGGLLVLNLVLVKLLQKYLFVLSYPDLETTKIKFYWPSQTNQLEA